MIDDALLKVADNEAHTSQATVVSAKSIDLQSARDIGEGERLYMNIHIDVTHTSSGSATVNFQLITTDNADLTGNVKVLAQTGAIAYASLVAGTNYYLPIPPQIGTKGQRYLGMQEVIATADLTAGKYSATIVHGIEDAKGKEYPSGFSIK